MKTVGTIWGVCLLLSMASFGTLMIEDRRVGIALPYSVPLAFAITLFAAAALFIIGGALLAPRPVRRPAAPPRNAAPAAAVAAARRRLAPEGVVLLDLSSLVSFRWSRPWPDPYRTRSWPDRRCS